VNTRKVVRVANGLMHGLSTFVLLVDGILLGYYVMSNLIEAINGKYGQSTYDSVVVSSLVGIGLATFYLGVKYEKEQDTKHRRPGREKETR
jgi:hypothetical protein